MSRKRAYEIIVGAREQKVTPFVEQLFARGNRVEPLARAWIADRLGLVYANGESVDANRQPPPYRHAVHDNVMASPDDIVYVPDGAGNARGPPMLVEYKAPSVDTMPTAPKIEHFAQVLLQMQCTGVRRALLVYFIDANDAAANNAGNARQARVFLVLSPEQSVWTWFNKALAEMATCVRTRTPPGVTRDRAARTTVIMQAAIASCTALLHEERSGGGDGGRATAEALQRRDRSRLARARAVAGEKRHAVGAADARDGDRAAAAHRGVAAQ